MALCGPRPERSGSPVTYGGSRRHPKPRDVAAQPLEAFWARHRNLLFQCQFSERNPHASDGSLSGIFPGRLYLLLGDLHVQDHVVNQLRQSFLHGAFEFAIF